MEYRVKAGVDRHGTHFPVFMAEDDAIIAALKVV